VCRHEWDGFTPILSYRRCPVPTCSSQDVLPVSWPKMIQAATNLGINDTTPVLDIYNACTVVLGKEPMAELGIMEFMRLVRRLKNEVEARKISHGASVKL